MLQARIGPTLPAIPWWAGRAGVLAAVVVIAYWLSLGSLWSDVGGQTPLAFVGLAPLLALGLLLSGLARRSQLPFPGRIDLLVGGLLIALAGAMVLLAPSLASIYFWTARLDVASLPLFTAGALIILFGWRVLFVARGAMVLLLMAWPLPHMVFLENTSTLLTDLTAGGLAAFTAVVPVATAAPGPSAVFVVNHETEPFRVLVASACAGLNSTVAFILVGSAFAMLLRGSVSRKIAWFTTGLLVVFGLNVARVIVIVAAGWMFGRDLAMDVLHPVAGMLSLVVGLVIMLMLLPRFGLEPPALVHAPPSATPLPERPAPARPGRSMATRAALLAVVAILFGAVNGTFAAYESGREFTASAPEFDGAVAVPVATGATAVGGWRVAAEREVTIGRPYFGTDSTWLRFMTSQALAVPGADRYVAWMDSIVVSDRQALSDYGVEKCYLFHAHTIDGVEQVPLGRGVLGKVMSVTRTDGSARIVLWWEWPVRVDGEIRHERIALFADSQISPDVIDRTKPTGPLLLVGDGQPIVDELRPLVDDLSAHAEDIVAEQTSALAAAR